MPILIFLISLIVFIKSIAYSIFEIKNNNNRVGGISVIIISIVSLILPTVMSIIR